MSTTKATLTMEQSEVERLADQANDVLLKEKGTKVSTYGGWMMIATILVEAWDLYAMSFVLIFIKAEYKPNALEIGWLAGGVQAGALLGAILGGWLADRLGRRRLFLLTMLLFVILALIQAFSVNVWDLITMRILIGVPLGADIAVGYTYIMESMSRGARDKMGSRWQGMFGLGEVLSIVVVTIMYASGIDHAVLWRVALGIGAVPAFILLLARINLPETPMALILSGKFVEAKKVARNLFDEPLDMIPDQDALVTKPKVGDFLKVIWADRTKRRASIFAWISNACQGAEFTAFGFYIPVILVTAGVGVASGGNLIGTNLVTAAIFVVATISGFLAPVMIAKTGHRGVARWGFGLAFIGLLLGALGLGANIAWVIIIGAAVLMWGHYWDASNGMTIASMVAPARFKGTASGFGYIFVKGASFFGAFVFPLLTAAWGPVGATLAVSVLSLVGFLAAQFILPEVYRYIENEKVQTA
ncbi:MAG TPA: MFS transporter [Microbacteriaceae bacterium]|nr:MFS transporter [Microbacteriaceae bacterium]